MLDLISIRVADVELGEPTPVPAGTVSGKTLYTADGVELGQVQDIVRADGKLYLLLGTDSPLSGGNARIVLPLERAVQVGDRLVFAGLAPPAIRELAQFDSAGAEILPQDEEVPLGSR